MNSISAQQTKDFGRKLAKEILRKSPREQAVVLALQGELGSGKTCFVQGFAQGLGIKEKILSPTFVIMKRFHVPCSMFHAFYHFDCYRIENPKEILELGFKEIIANPKNIIAIEWAERIEGILPRECTVIKFDFINRTERKITTMGL